MERRRGTPSWNTVVEHDVETAQLSILLLTLTNSGYKRPFSLVVAVLSVMVLLAEVAVVDRAFVRGAVILGRCPYLNTGKLESRRRGSFGCDSDFSG